MGLDADIYAYLVGQAGITNLVSTRVYPNVLPQNSAYPSITYSRVSDNPVRAMSADASVKQSRYQFDAWGTSAESARALADQIISALNGYVGSMNGNTVVQGIWHDDTVAIHDIDPETKEIFYQYAIDFFIWAEE